MQYIALPNTSDARSDLLRALHRNQTTGLSFQGVAAYVPHNVRQHRVRALLHTLIAVERDAGRYRLADYPPNSYDTNDEIPCPAPFLALLSRPAGW